MSQVVFSMVKTVHLVMRSWFVAANVTMTNLFANATNSNAKPPNSTAKVTNSTANGTKSTAKPTNSIAKTCKYTYICMCSHVQDKSLSFYMLVAAFLQVGNSGFLPCL